MFDLIHMTLIKSGSTKMNKMKSQKNDSHHMVQIGLNPPG